MRKKRKSYIAVTGSIRSEWLRGLSRKICIGALAFSAAVVLLTGGKVGAYASDQTRVSSDESQVTVGYDDLDDTLQKGGLGVVVEQQDGAASLASTYDATALEKRIVEGIKAWQTSIDVSELGLTRDDIDNGAVKSIINSHPEFISLSGGYTYWTSGSSITKIQFTYLTNAKEEQQELDAALQEVKSKIDTSGMSDEEIVLAYHEYLTSTVAYAYEDYFNGTIAANHGYDMYGALVKHSCVCQGYAETMFYLLREAGLSCAIASSENINHAWNIVKIHGKWYHIDATWDDPVWDMPGRSYHDYFLVSFDTMNKNTLINHTKDRTDMVVSAQWGDTYTTAVDTTYESGKFWNGIEKAIFYKDGYWYSISEGSSKTSFNINKYQYSTNINKVLYSGTAKWTTPSGGYYPGVYSSIYLRGDNLYFTTPDSLNKIDITSTNVNPTELINIRTQYNSSTGNNLYAFGEQYGKLVYFITDSPNIKKTKDSSNSSKYNKEYAEYTFEMCISHKWDAGVVTKEPTYTSTGTKKYTCTNCGETKTETIAKLVCTSHVWDSGKVVTAPTYKTEGTKKYTCKNCGTTKTETIAKLICTNHAWDAGVVTKKPTYTSTGTKKYTCTNCGETKTETIAKLVCKNHAWDAGEVVTAPTYKTEGTKKYTCKNCGTTKTETIAKLVCTSHVWDSGVVTKKPTYTSTGTKKYTCKNCGTTKTETIAKLVCTSHVWDAGVVTKKPTYTSTGTKKYTCTNCGETKTETIAKLVCTSHVWDAGVVTKKPTYTSAGTKEYTCVNCGTTKTSSIAMLKLSKVTVKTAVSSTGIKISWTSEKNASGYYIYRKSGKGQYALLKKVTGANTLAFNDTKVTSGVIYTYKVQAYKGTVIGAGTETSRCFVGTAKAKTANESTGIKLSWNKVGGARSYKIYKRIGTGKYTCIKTASSTTFTYLDKAVKAGTIYTYAVKPYIGRTAGTYVASKYVRLRPVTAKVSAARNGVTVRWTKTAGATSYRVYRKTASGKYALVKKIGGANALSWTDTNTAKGKTYYYYVRAFKGNYYSAASKAVNVKR
ncbi:transglutaminase domain-containing protein [Coprococcus eutactus]|uniref:transglutaminase domain-containing protein n=1 Tax=Coprococcus eutactus TaxID=33043 RepID=UPI003219BA2D